MPVPCHAEPIRAAPAPPSPRVSLEGPREPARSALPAADSRAAPRGCGAAPGCPCPRPPRRFGCFERGPADAAHLAGGRWRQERRASFARPFARGGRRGAVPRGGRPAAARVCGQPRSCVGRAGRGAGAMRGRGAARPPGAARRDFGSGETGRRGAGKGRAVPRLRERGGSLNSSEKQRGAFGLGGIKIRRGKTRERSQNGVRVNGWHRALDFV